MGKELTNGRHRAKQLIHQFNTHFPEGATVGEMEKYRSSKLREIFGATGEDSWVEPPLFVDYGCNTKVGDRFYANFK